MTNVLQDWKNVKGAWLYVFIAFYLLFLSSFLFAWEPRDLFYLNEMFMIPLVVLGTVLILQREFGGYFSEIYATFPVSMPLMMLRKILQLYVFIATIHLFWTVIYRVKFGSMKTVLYYYKTDEAVFQEVSWLNLFVQSVPAYLVITGVTLLGMVLTKKVYGGLGAGFAVWMFEVISTGGITGEWTLFTIFIPMETAFARNRLGLLAIFIVLLLLSFWWANKREKWIVADDSN